MQMQSDHDSIKLEIPGLILLTITVDYWVYYNLPIYYSLLLLLNLSMNVSYIVFVAYTASNI